LQRHASGKAAFADGQTAFEPELLRKSSIVLKKKPGSFEHNETFGLLGDDHLVVWDFGHLGLVIRGDRLFRIRRGDPFANRR
jgi:hypothetical protein